MITKEEVIEKLRLGMQICLEENKSKVTRQNMRLALKIEKGGMFEMDGVSIQLLNVDDQQTHGNIKVGELFAINYGKEMLLKPWLVSKLKDFAKKDGIPEAQLTAHIYPADENFNSGVRILGAGKEREITIEELTN